MNDIFSRDPSVEAHSTCSDQESADGIWLGLLGAPLSWIAQVSLSEPLAAHTCYPYEAPLSAPIFTELPILLAAISLVCLAAALLSGLAVWSLWQRTIDVPTGEKKSDSSEGKRRNRFLLSLGAMSSFIFTLAIVFNICALWLIPLCSSWF